MHRSICRALAAGLVLVALALPGCGSSSGDTSAAGGPSLQQLAETTLAGRPGVERVDLSGTSTGGPVDLSVVMATRATADEIGDAAEAARTFSHDHAGHERWTTHVYVGEPARVQLEIYPKVRTSARADAQAAVHLATVRGVQQVSIAAGTPYVRAGQVEDLPRLVPQLRADPLWSAGGSLEAGDGRVRLMDEPKRVSSQQLLAIAQAAVDHPGGEFWLEAAATGDRYPELYVSKVTAAEAAAITRAFTSPALLSDNAEGYELDFTMRAQGADDPNQPVDSTGTFGRR